MKERRERKVEREGGRKGGNLPPVHKNLLQNPKIERVSSTILV